MPALIKADDEGTYSAGYHLMIAEELKRLHIETMWGNSLMQLGSIFAKLDSDGTR